MDHDEACEPIGLGDADLVLRSRSGDRGAFGELWRRHYRAGVTVARNVTSSLDAEDLVQEAYTRIYQSILTGRGPTGSFRAYLFASIRNTAATWGRAQRDAAYDELEDVADPAAQEHASEAALDRGLTHQAFRSLPTRWQEVLWYSEIEHMKPAEIAPLLGMKATAVAQLTFRAREGLREAWIQAHLRRVADGSDCQWTIERLGAHTRRNLGRRDHAKVDRHLAECVRCAIVASEAKEVSSRLALVLLPLALGATGAAGYLATVQGGSAPLVALAAMPSGVVQGAVTVLPTVTEGAAGGASAGATGAGAAGAATTTSGAVGAASSAGGASLGAAGASAATASAGAATGTLATSAATIAALGGSAIASAGAASGIAASLVVVGGVVAAAVVLPETAPGPVQLERTSVSHTVPATPGPLSPAEDSAGVLPDVGPGPADIPAIPAAVDGTTGGGTGPEAGGEGITTGGAEGGAETTTGSGAASPAAGAVAGNGGTDNSGTGNRGTENGITGNGNGRGTDGTPGNGGVTGNGSPTNGTANGNGGGTADGGANGNGTPGNGTGNGNGGVHGNGNENNGKGTGAAPGDAGEAPTSPGPRGVPAAEAAAAGAAGIRHGHPHGVPSGAGGAPVEGSDGDGT